MMKSKVHLETTILSDLKVFAWPWSACRRGSGTRPGARAGWPRL